jgi:hypothetical protein
LHRRSFSRGRRTAFFGKIKFQKKKISEFFFGNFEKLF